MPKLLNRVPKYRKHKASGQAVVTLSGHDVYLGPYGTAASREAYDRAIAEWLAAGKQAALVQPAAGITVVELVAAFLKQAEGYYCKPDGTPTGEIETFKYALRPLVNLYGRTLAADFGPLKLKTVREEMIRLNWARRTINSQVARVKLIFKWAVGEELIPADVYHGLQAVAGLKAGRTKAREMPPVAPVADEVVAATLPFLSRQVKAMVELQQLTGMRPGEVVNMRGCDLDMSGKLWIYRPAHHKTEHHGHRREIPLGPRARSLVEQFLKPDLQAYLFSPAEAESELNITRRKERRTPLTPSALARRGRQRPENNAGDSYDVDAYRRAIARACDRAFPLTDELKAMAEEVAAWRQAFEEGHHHKPGPCEVPEDVKAKLAKLRGYRSGHRWHPNQLRHTAATRLRHQYGVEAAQVILGHKTLTVTQVYAEKNVAMAHEIMAKVG